MVDLRLVELDQPVGQPQDEHNCFTTKPDVVPVVRGPVRAQVEQHRRRHRERRLRPAAARHAGESRCRPSAQPASATTVDALKWYGGPWAHKYDVYFGTTTNSAARRRRSRARAERQRRTRPARSATRCRRAAPGHDLLLARRRQRRWRNMTRTSAVWSFTTAGTAAAAARRRLGERRRRRALRRRRRRQGRSVASSVRRDRGRRRQDARNPNAERGQDHDRHRPRPPNYFEMTFNAEAGRRYRLWMRGKADSNNWRERLGVRAVLRTPSRERRRHLADRHDVGHRGQPRGLQRLRRRGLGLAGQRLRHGVSARSSTSRRPGRRRCASRRARTASRSIRSCCRTATFVDSSPGALKNDTTILLRTN